MLLILKRKHQEETGRDGGMGSERGSLCTNTRIKVKEKKARHDIKHKFR